jgi:hypothetical protein
MNHLDFDFDDLEIADDIIRNIEKDYGKRIARIPCFKRTSEPYTYEMKIIFTDFKLFEGQIRIVPSFFDFITVQVDGTYY